MKLYLNCYVWGEGYTTKCFDTSTHEIRVGSRTMDEQERVLFVCSNARMLLANIDDHRFGFVRNIASGNKDENGRRCVINIALKGEKTEIDGFFYGAVACFHRFAGMVREMIDYKDADFMINWEKYRVLNEFANQYLIEDNSSRKIALLMPEPSLDYFIKNCGMNFSKADIAKQLTADCFMDEAEFTLPQSERLSGQSEKNSEGKYEMKVFFYCPTPSMGWILRRVDEKTGNTLTEGVNAKKEMSRESMVILDNYGCKMALFRVENRQCFLIKDVKADKMDQYGQLKTVSFVIESEQNQEIIRRLAVWALFDFVSFQSMLLECIKICAGTIGYTVNSEKLQRLLESNSRYFTDQSKEKQDRLIREEDRPYTFLVLASTFDYFVNSTGLNINQSDVFELYQEDRLNQSDGFAIFSEDAVSSKKENMKVVKSPASKVTDGECHEKLVQETNMKKEETDTVISEDFVNLLDHPSFIAIVIILAVALITIIVFLIRHSW